MLIQLPFCAGSVEAHIVVAVTNPNIIFVTGDIAATSAVYGLEFREVVSRPYQFPHRGTSLINIILDQTLNFSVLGA
jgi:hypothetical protein